jgi:hypothetical protein
MSEHPIRHPELQRITDENALLREELTGLLTELDGLLVTVKPNLLAIYQSRIGVWEMRLLQAQFEVARLRRCLELAQASLSRGLPPDPQEIEGMIELESLGWQQQLQEAADRIRTAEQRLKHLLPPAEDRELKKLYYALVKRLHPDVNLELSDAQRHLWQRVQEAYAASDLAELRALTLLAERDAAAPPPKSLDRLRQEQAILSRQITETLKRIQTIESQPPFTLRASLEDETWLAARRGEIDAQINQLRTRQTALATHLKHLIPEQIHAKRFDQN